MRSPVSTTSISMTRDFLRPAPSMACMRNRPSLVNSEFMTGANYSPSGFSEGIQDLPQLNCDFTVTGRAEWVPLLVDIMVKANGEQQHPGPIEPFAGRET